MKPEEQRPQEAKKWLEVGNRRTIVNLVLICVGILAIVKSTLVICYDSL